MCLTQNRNTKIVYATYLAEEGQEKPPAKISLHTLQPTDEAAISLLGMRGKLKWAKTATGFSVEIPKSFRDNPPCKDAWTLKISQIREKRLGTIF